MDARASWSTGPGLCLALLLAGCAPPPRPAPTTTAAAATPAAAAGAQRFLVVDSHLTVQVHRDGPLARLGHNHVISSRGLVGHIDLASPRAATRFRLELPLESLEVDLPAERAAAGPDFVAPVPDGDRVATRRNMLGDGVLDAARQPVAIIESVALAGGPDDWRARVRIGLTGRNHDVELPVHVALDGDGLTVRGAVVLDHAALGLRPFSVALGALRVRPDLALDFSLRARPAGP